MAAALKILSGRAISEVELHRRLIKDFANLPAVDQEVHATIEHLKDLHLINDLRIAENLALRFSHKGNRYIKVILAQKGVKEDVIDEMLEKLDPEEQRAFIEAKKKLRSFKLDKNEECPFGKAATDQKNIKNFKKIVNFS